MSNELILTTTADSNVYSIVLNDAGLVWQTTTSTFVTVVDANWANYDIAMTESGTSTGIYYGDFPSGITTAGTYTIFGYIRSGGSPVVSDAKVGEGEVFWDGTAVSSSPSGYDLVSLADVRAYLGITTTTYNAVLSLLISQCSASITSYCDQVLVNQSVTDTYDYFEAKRFLKLRNIIETALTTVTFNKYSGTELSIPTTEFYVSDCGTVRFKPSSSYGPAFYGIIEVVYTAGYTTIPSDLRQACMLMTKLIFDVKSVSLAVEKETIGDYSYTIGATVDINADMFAPVRVLLDGVYTNETINL